LITGADKLSKWFLEIAKKSETNIGEGKYEILENQTEVKIMGEGIYEDYSKALDNSLKITKGFMIGCVALFLTSLFL
jgi:putative membrane protein